ncbi:MAG: orotidine-5'-phosphate decarboxylase [Candidatus Omnitrophica bacterium CG08_land_8_20_14_0_20_41_16]|uniref:Orotidine 5'-phosphate decarboxylase n=1 Tax=Candidatus Sherwoodlollariibacterium unditelluris TaxID=1974757 RepID=A0A2G9YHT9_9BACT|nr:MAG: orotidine-5'-phosphate decarboxylase [Candidatus Omnitrophica bacterium CG23_combo_of_CG06-09_8_20_14_all_41_10]PIS34143.1 MAG: orotidine-5'-phosphate decarboxylase [Candidatus Omnitrophica bacterium CG08_land_8_20_14_0_20_41_16]
MKPEIILALDVDSLERAKYFVNKLYPAVKIFKVGSQLFTACGPKVIDILNKKGASVFLDLKFFDIPNTIAHAVRNAIRLKVKMMTLHILGDEEMIKAAVSAARDESKRLKIKKPLLIGVTVLTSKEARSSDVLTLARIGIECGLDGIVCSAREAKFLRQAIKKKFLIVTPGIRPKGAGKNDQRRTATVREAIQSGSNFLVVGRPILEAREPLIKAKEILGDIHGRRN